MQLEVTKERDAREELEREAADILEWETPYFINKMSTGIHMTTSGQIVDRQGTQDWAVMLSVEKGADIFKKIEMCGLVELLNELNKAIWGFRDRNCDMVEGQIKGITFTINYDRLPGYEMEIREVVDENEENNARTNRKQPSPSSTPQPTTSNIAEEDVELSEAERQKKAEMVWRMHSQVDMNRALTPKEKVKFNIFYRMAKQTKLV